MDADLREFLEAMEQRLREETKAGFKQVESRLDGVETRISREVAGLRDEIVFAYDKLREDIREGDKETRQQIEELDQKVDQLLESMVSDHRYEERERLVDTRFGVLEEEVRSHSRRLTTLEAKNP